MQPEGVESFMARVRQAIDEVSELARLDGALMRAECRFNLGRIWRAGVWLAMGVAFFMAVFAFVCVAAFISLIIAGLHPLYAALCLALASLIGAAVCVSSARSAFGAASLVPKRTLNQVRENLSALKAGLSDAKQ